MIIIRGVNVNYLKKVRTYNMYFIHRFSIEDNKVKQYEFRSYAGAYNAWYNAQLFIDKRGLIRYTNLIITKGVRDHGTNKETKTK